MEYFDRLTGAEKAPNVVTHQNWISMFNSLVLCKFANVPPPDLRELINLATGQDYTFTDLLRTGERAWNLKRIINYHFGMRKADDNLPKRFLQPYHDYGEDSISIVPDFQEMLEAYYHARGWIPETAYPSREKLVQLDLEWTASGIEPEDIN